MNEIVGQVLSGSFSRIVARQKSGARIEIGDLLVCESPRGKILLQCYDLIFGSQLSQQNLELISGLRLEEGSELEFYDPDLRSYSLAMLKNLVSITKNEVTSSKALPDFFSEVRRVEPSDLTFLTKPQNPLFVGKLRSGSKTIEQDIFLDGEKAFSHHILIPAQTGRGKSNLASCMLWQVMLHDYAGILVLDAHDEYYGRNKLGLKDHPNQDKAVYFTTRNPPPGAISLRFNLQDLVPSHFDGVVNWSDAQSEALSAFYKKYKEQWIESILLEKEAAGFKEGTMSVVKRRLSGLLDLFMEDGQLASKGIFSKSATSVMPEIISALEKARVVIIDTSSFSGSLEILVGSMLASEIFSRYKSYKVAGLLDEKPVISVLLEEAPRVLGKEVLERGPNIFSTIAREGRKFKIGITAITQIPSLIPRDILANMGTKIILGLEMAPERQAIIESAAQDLSDYDQSIASLDKGEAIITSTFSRFAMPIKIPLFEEMAARKPEFKKSFGGVKQ